MAYGIRFRHCLFPAARSIASSMGILLLAASAVHAEAVDFPTAAARALRNNAFVSAAKHEAAAAREDVGAARGAWLPSLVFEERFVRTTVPGEAFAFKMNQSRFEAPDFAVSNINDPPPLNDFVGSLTLEQPLFAPKIPLGIRMARKEAEAKDLELSRRKEEIVFRVLSAWLDVRTAREYLRVAERGVSDAREHLRLAEAAEKAGTGLPSDVLRARVFLAQAEGRGVTAGSRLEIARRALGLSMGEKGGAAVDAQGDVPSLPEEGTLEARIETARGRRTDLEAVLRRVENAEANVALRRSEYLPTIGAMGAIQMDARDNPLSPDNRTWKIGVGMKWSLFDGLRRESGVAKAAAEKARAAEYYRGAEDTAAFEASRAFLDVRDARRRLEIARASEAAAREGTRLVKARYGNQLARMIDLLDAQAAQDGAQADLVRAENDVLQAGAALEFASGTLLSWAEGPGGEAKK